MKYIFTVLVLLLSYVGFGQNTNSASLIQTDTSHSWTQASKAIVSLQPAQRRVFVVFDNGNQIDLKEVLKFNKWTNYMCTPEVSKNILIIINYMESRGYTLVTSASFNELSSSAQYIFIRK
jgi:hypothetical protein